MARILEAEKDLARRQKEFAVASQRIEQERRERETTLPPFGEIEDRRRLREHEDTLSRREATNILRDQRRSILLQIMLLIATGTLIWWGITLMQR